MKKSNITPIVLIMLIMAGLLLTGCAREREGTTPTEPPATTGETTTQSEQSGQPAVTEPQAPASESSATQPEGEPTTLAIATATPTPAAATGETTTEAAETESTTETTAEATATPVTSQTGSEETGDTDTSTGGDRIHVVQPGQNLFRIALQYGLDVDTLAKYNGITNPELIYVGQKIKIPGGGNIGGTYVVQAGDTLLSIAVKFNTTTEALMAANGLSNANLIYVGQELNVP